MARKKSRKLTQQAALDAISDVEDAAPDDAEVWIGRNGDYDEDDPYYHIVVMGMETTDYLMTGHDIDQYVGYKNSGPAVPVWALLVPVTLLLLLLGLARTSTPPSSAQQVAPPVSTGPLRFGQATPLHPSPVARPPVVERVLDSGTGHGSTKYGATAHTSHAPAPTATAPGTIVIHNEPRTVVVGQAERFSVLLSGQPHTWLTYILHYPDGHEEHIPVRTDGHGYASYTFRVSPYQARRFRETGTVGVEDAHGRVLASTHIAFQQH